MESGGGRNDFDSVGKAEQAGLASAKSWGVADDPAALRALPTKTVLSGASMMSGGESPMIDGRLVPELPLAAFRAGRIAHVPYMIGTNAYEMGAFGPMADTVAGQAKAIWPQVEATYDGYGRHTPEMVKGEFGTDVFMTEPARALARAAEANGQPAYVYYFDYLRPSQRNGKLPGPIHFDEVYLVFDSMKTAPPPPSDDPKAVEMVQSRWADFAKTGRPGPGWPEFKDGDEQVMDFTNDGAVARKDFRKAKLDLVEQWAQTPR